jgi:hypothetical protein
MPNGNEVYSGSSVPLGYASALGNINKEMKARVNAYNRAEAEKNAAKARARALLAKEINIADERRALIRERTIQPFKPMEKKQTTNTSEANYLTGSSFFTGKGGRRRTIRRKRANRKTRRRA